jgi:N4-(beta-N-acetylglucosaminyl)-L-asparaginase
MRFLPAYQTVESMRNGMSPSDAATDAIKRIAKYYPKFVGAIVAIDKMGNHGAACHGIDKFPYSVGDKNHNDVYIVEVDCI